MNNLNKNLESKFAEINHLKNLHEKAMAQANAMGDQLKDAQEKMRNVGKAIAEMKGKLRSSVADSLRRKFGSQSLNVQVDADTGNVTLLMDNNLLFKKNSFDLSDQAQNNLSKIAPIYAEVIFGDPQVSSKIEAIEITGHASPSYKKNYIDPKAENPEAYGHNMRLSAQRAASIANFMMGKQIGIYPFKDSMRESLFAIGRSYISPIEKPKAVGRDLASVENNCGPYNCELSQRVEISFRLKDDMKAIEKLINMAGAK
jgi:outer membrane protein OmpA-like peptidoglycan-associated protein